MYCLFVGIQNMRNDSGLREEAFRAAVRVLLKRRGLTQAELARRANMHRSTLSSILTGQSAGEDENRRKIASALGYTYEELLDIGSELLGGPPISKIEKFPYYLEAQKLPPHSIERATFIYEKAGQTVGFDAVMFFNEKSLRAMGDELPGWVEYLQGDIDDIELYRIALEEMERRLNIVKKALRERKRRR